MREGRNIKKEVAEYRTEVRLTKTQYKILKMLGGASTVLKQKINEKAGDKKKLLSLRAEKHREIEEIDALIKECDEGVAEELRLKQEEKQKQISRKPQPKPTLNRKKDDMELEVLKKRWRGFLESGEWTELSENNYEYLIKAVNLQTKEQVDAWLWS